MSHILISLIFIIFPQISLILFIFLIRISFGNSVTQAPPRLAIRPDFTTYSKGLESRNYSGFLRVEFANTMSNPHSPTTFKSGKIVRKLVITFTVFNHLIHFNSGQIPQSSSILFRSTFLLKKDQFIFNLTTINFKIRSCHDNTIWQLNSIIFFLESKKYSDFSKSSSPPFFRQKIYEQTPFG